jgi:hypothetical protein
MGKGVEGDEGAPVDIMSRSSSARSSRSSPNVTIDTSSRGTSQAEARPRRDSDLSDHAHLYAAIDRTIDRCVPEVSAPSPTCGAVGKT